MAYDREQIKLSVSGFLGGAAPGNEIWSWGLHFTGDLDFNSAQALVELDLDAVAQAAQLAHSSAGLALSGDAKLLTVKAAAVTTGGAYIGEARTSEPNGTTGVAGIGLRRPPNQIALVVSLRADSNLGAATHGRFYLPLPTFAPGPNGRIDSSAVTSAIAVLKTMLDDMNSEFQAGGEPARLCLMSNVVLAPVKTRSVTRVLLGDVLDTMQSRRESLDEAYASVDLAGI